MTWEPWMWAGLATFSGAVTLAGRWLVSRRHRSRMYGPEPWASIAADLIWASITFLAGLLAIRYAERMPRQWWGYVGFGLGVILLTLARSELYWRTEAERTAKQVRARPRRHDTMHSLIYPIFAICLYLLLWSLLRRPIAPWHALPLVIGAWLPDLDSAESLAGRAMPFLARRIERWLGTDTGWHSLSALGLVAVGASPLALLGWSVWLLILLGFASHLAVDVLRPLGIPLLWPFSRTRYAVFRGIAGDPGSRAERRLGIALGVIAAGLLMIAATARPNSPAAVGPSYEETVDRYQSLRGRYLVLANVEGVWQASGRPIIGQFEILTTEGSSYVMLDRYTGRIVRAGRSAEDHIRLNRIDLIAASSVQIRPVEVQLGRQQLADTLPLLYQMQQEAGLQHIFVSGEIVLAEAVGADPPILHPDYSQLGVHRIEKLSDGRYKLRFLTGADLIALAQEVRVQEGAVLLVATYVRPASGPTVTPLPPAAGSAEPTASPQGTSP